MGSESSTSVATGTRDETVGRVAASPRPQTHARAARFEDSDPMKGTRRLSLPESLTAFADDAL